MNRRALEGSAAVDQWEGPSRKDSSIKPLNREAGQGRKEAVNRRARRGRTSAGRRWRRRRARPSDCPKAPGWTRTRSGPGRSDRNLLTPCPNRSQGGGQSNGGGPSRGGRGPGPAPPPGPVPRHEAAWPGYSPWPEGGGRRRGKGGERAGSPGRRRTCLPVPPPWPPGEGGPARGPGRGSGSRRSESLPPTAHRLTGPARPSRRRLASPAVQVASCVSHCFHPPGRHPCLAPPPPRLPRCRLRAPQRATPSPPLGPAARPRSRHRPSPPPIARRAPPAPGLPPLRSRVSHLPSSCRRHHCHRRRRRRRRSRRRRRATRSRRACPRHTPCCAPPRDDRGACPPCTRSLHAPSRRAGQPPPHRSLHTPPRRAGQPQAAAAADGEAAALLRHRPPPPADHNPSHFDHKI